MPTESGAPNGSVSVYGGTLRDNDDGVKNNEQSQSQSEPELIHNEWSQSQSEPELKRGTEVTTRVSADSDTQCENEDSAGVSADGGTWRGGSEAKRERTLGVSADGGTQQGDSKVGKIARSGNDDHRSGKCSGVPAEAEEKTIKP